MRWAFLALHLALFLVVLAGPARAETVDEIIEKARQSQQVDNSIQKMRMVLISRSGAERVREFELRVRKDGELIKSWTRFSHPSDVRGTQLVLVDHPDRADEQLLYLPALKRVTRISGKARSGSFMGSDYAYEDLESSSASDARHTLLSEDAAAWVIDTVPGGDSSYGRIRSHISKADHVPRKVEFFDKGNQPVKVLEVLEVRREGGLVVPVRSEMRNLQKGTRTRLEVLEQRLNVPESEIPDETFTSAWMERSG